MIKKLNFSNIYFEVYYYQDQPLTKLENFSTLVNLSPKPIKIDFVSQIQQDKSYLLYKDIQPLHVDEGLLVKYNFDPSAVKTELHNYCVSNWDSNKVRFPNDPSKWNYPILRSPVEKFDNFEFNCWYLPKETASSIHKEHVFTEVHTQIYGLGIMNKFTENSKDTLYQRMYMAPGYTHDYFFDKETIYPWHQYEAVTDCIWMAICRYNR